MKYNYPSGMVIFLPESGASVPDGWTLVSAANGKLIRSGSSHGNTGGGGHTHSFNPESFDSSSKLVGGVSTSIVGGGWNVVDDYHKHSIDRAVAVSDEDESLPPYIDVMMIVKD